MCPKDQEMRLGISPNTSCTIYLQHLHKRGERLRVQAMGPCWETKCVSHSRNEIQGWHAFYRMPSGVMWGGDSMGLWLTDQSPGTKSHPFQSDSDMHRMGLAHSFHICSLCSVLFVRWHDKKGTRHSPNCKEQPDVAGDVLRYSFESALTTDPFPDNSLLPEGFLCLRGVLWQSRKLKLLEVSSLSLLAFVKGWIDEDIFLGVLDTKDWKGCIFKGKKREAEISPVPRSRLKCWVWGNRDL